MVVRNTKWSQNFRGRGKITWPHSYIRLKMEQTCDQHCVERFETLISSGSVKARKSPYQRYYSILYYMYLLRTWIYLYTVFHYSLPNYLSVDMERIQKRVHSIVYPQRRYEEAMIESGLLPLHVRRIQSCDKLFNQILDNRNHKLN